MVWTLSYEVDGASSRGKRPWDVRELWWTWVLVHSGQLFGGFTWNPLSFISSQLWGFLWFCFFGSIQVYFSNKGSWTIWALCLIQRVGVSQGLFRSTGAKVIWKGKNFWSIWKRKQLLNAHVVVCLVLPTKARIMSKWIQQE
jgi:hypothetical protein